MSFGFGFVLLGPVWGLANLVFSSIMSQHRVDDISRDGGMSNDPRSIARRLDAANYDRTGKRLLPWFIASAVLQMVVFLIWILRA